MTKTTDQHINTKLNKSDDNTCISGSPMLM